MQVKLAIIFLIFFASCRSIKHTTKVISDSLSRTVKDTSSVIVKDSSSLGVDTSSYYREVVIDVDSGIYAPNGSSTYDPGIYVSADDYRIVFPKNAKKIAIREKAKTGKTDSVNVSTAFSSGSSSTVENETYKLEEKVDKKTKLQWMPIAMFGILILIILIVIDRYKSKILPFLKSFIK